MYVAEAKRLTNAGAKKMLATATDRAREAGIAIAVAIADAGGHLILLERMDGGRFHTVHSATTKAVCAASTRRPSMSRMRSGLRSRPAPSAGPPWRAAAQSSSTANASAESE
jgi:glc operon protein GlcG